MLIKINHFNKIINNYFLIKLYMGIIIYLMFLKN